MTSWISNSRQHFQKSLLWSLLLHFSLAGIAALVLHQAAKSSGAVIDLTFSLAPETAPPIAVPAQRAAPKKEWTVNDKKLAPVPAAQAEDPALDDLADCPYPCVAREGDFVAASSGMRLPRPFGTLIRESDYPASAKRESLEGTVVALLFIDAKGKVQKVTILSSTDPRFSEAVEKRLSEVRFRPALNEAGQEIPVRVKVPISFDIN